MREPRRLLVHGERRQGKISAIRQAGVRFTEEEGTLVWVDVATASGLDEFGLPTAGSISRAVRRSWIADISRPARRG